MAAEREQESGRMRVCILNDNFYRGSGITLVIKRLAASASFAEVELFLAGCDTVQGQAVNVEETGIVAPVRCRTFDLMQSGPGLVPALVRFARWLREIRCDLIHAHHRRLAVLADLIRPFTGVPVLFTGHLTFSDAAWFKMLAPARVTGVSPSVVEYLRRSTRAKEIALVYNPYEFGTDRGKPMSRNPWRVVSIGRLDAVKDHATLIEAWSLLRERGVEAQLDIFGEGPLRGSLEALIRERGLGASVTLHGFVENVEERLASYAFNVLVSEREGLPNAVVEAASRRIPSLLTDVDGSRDTLPDELALPNGIPFGDAAALAEALAVWLRSPELVEADGERFYCFLKGLCSPAAIGRQYTALYAEALRASRDRARLSGGVAC